MISQRFTDLRFRGSFTRKFAALFLAIHLGVSSIGLSQSDNRAPNSTLKYFDDDPKREGDANLQSEADQSAGFGLPYSRVFRSTDEVDLYKETRIDPREVNFSSGGLRVEGGVLRGRFGFPFTGKALFRPEDAEIRIGSFYIDIRSLSAHLLYTDNVDRSEFNRESDSILGLRLDFAVLAPLTERLKISASGSFVYLPLKNRVGFAVFDPLRDFVYDPFIRAQLAYDLTVADWEVELINDFSILQLPYDLQLSYSYFGGEFEDPERTGRYSYIPAPGAATVFQDRSPYGRFDAGLVRAKDKAGGKVSRMLPTDTRAEFGFFHSEYWYLSGESVATPLFHSLDQGYFKLKSEHENFRFKPFALYTATKYDFYQHWEHEVKGGVEGPITENMDFYGDVGQRWVGITASQQGADIWDMRIKHQIGPYTSHLIQYLHDVTAPDTDIRDRWLYQISQIIGNGLTADFYGTYATFEDIDNTGTGTDEWRAGMRFTYKVSPRTTFQIVGTYEKTDYQTGISRNSVVWRSLGVISHRFTPSFEMQLLYERTDREAKRKGDSFYENFGTVSLIKYF